MLSFPRKSALIVAGLLAVGFVGTGCKHDDSMAGADSKMMSGKTLYDRLGGEPAITAVVDDFVANAAPDPAVNFARKGHPNQWDPSPANVAKLKKHLVQFISMATGGPKTYEGGQMAPVHAGMQITNDEFNAIAGDLVKALDKNKVPKDLQTELLAVVETTRSSIVGK